MIVHIIANRPRMSKRWNITIIHGTFAYYVFIILRPFFPPDEYTLNQELLFTILIHALLIKFSRNINYIFISHWILSQLISCIPTTFIARHIFILPLLIHLFSCPRISQEWKNFTRHIQWNTLAAILYRWGSFMNWKYLASPVAKQLVKCE